jgi:hypothetical protein
VVSAAVVCSDVRAHCIVVAAVLERPAGSRDPACVLRWSVRRLVL